MIPLATSLWPELTASLALGLAIGALTGLPRSRAARLGAGLLFLGLAALAGLASTGTVPGRGGLWLESGALILGAYLAGCVLGGLGRLALRRT